MAEPADLPPAARAAYLLRAAHDVIADVAVAGDPTARDAAIRRGRRLIGHVDERHGDTTALGAARPLLDAADAVDAEPARARHAVSREVDTLRSLADQADAAGRHDRAEGLRLAAYHAERWLVGPGEGCVLTPFDPRHEAEPTR